MRKNEAFPFYVAKPEKLSWKSKLCEATPSPQHPRVPTTKPDSLCAIDTSHRSYLTTMAAMFGLPHSNPSFFLWHLFSHSSKTAQRVDENWIYRHYYSCFKTIIERLQRNQNLKSSKRWDMFYFKQPLSLLGLLFDTKGLDVQVFIILTIHDIFSEGSKYFL